MSKAYRIEWAPSAIDDLDEILEFIAVREGSDVARHIHAKIIARVDSLTTHPTRGRIVPELKEFGIKDYRELIVRPYRVFFRVMGRVVGIVGVLDGRRDLEELLVNRVLEPDGDR